VVSGQSANENSPAASSRAVLVELFTSEGCSSCPPADEFLRQVNGQTTPSGTLIVGLSEHVTYWNSGGWRDPYSASVYTDRQDAYGSRLRLDSVYTPQAVVNGEAQVVGSDRKAILKAIDNSGPAPTLAVHIASAELSGNALTIRYSVSGTTSGPKADIFAVVAADAASSKVLRGENAGHTLAHAAAARSLERIATVQGATEEKTARVVLSTGVIPSPSLHLVLFAQATGMGRIFSVATIPLK
jgi:hypothetical protein